MKLPNFWKLIPIDVNETLIELDFALRELEELDPKQAKIVFRVTALAVKPPRFAGDFSRINALL